MKTFHSKLLTIALACSLAAMPTLAGAPSPGDQIDDLIDRFFGSVRDTIKGLRDQADRLRDEAIAKANDAKNKANQAANDAQKMAQFFGSCPSPAAQQLYDDLKAKRAQLQQIRDAAADQDVQAQRNRDNCKNTSHLDPQCDSAYNRLPFQATRDACDAGINAINDALNALKSLQCVSGCAQTAKVVVPTFSLGAVGAIAGAAAGGAAARPVGAVAGGEVSRALATCEVCTQWDPGSFQVNFDAGNGELSESVRAKLPKCTRTETISLIIPVCQVDLSRLLPKLKDLKIVPPEVTLPSAQVTIPSRDVRVVSGLTQSSCSTPVKICKRPGTATVTINPSGNPLDLLRVTGSCAEEAVIGCSNPPFGLTPTFTTITIPDPKHAKISWSGLKIKPGSIEIDLTRPELGVTCSTRTVDYPHAPGGKAGKTIVDTGFCIHPQFAKLVSNP